MRRGIFILRCKSIFISRIFGSGTRKTFFPNEMPTLDASVTFFVWRGAQIKKANKQKQGAPLAPS